MINVVFAADLFRRPALAESMFRDRAAQFHHRLGWEVKVDGRGLEFDQYDDLNPLYVIMEDDEGQHVGSGRLMPTTGRTMLKEHFSDLTDGVQIESALIWETTRFCVSPQIAGDRRLAMRAPAALLWAGCEIALRSGVEFYAGVFSAPMLRVYKAAGWMPEVLGRRWTSDGEICAGLWEVTQQVRDALAARAAPKGEPLEITYLPDESRLPTPATLAGARGFAEVSELARHL